MIGQLLLAAIMLIVGVSALLYYLFGLWDDKDYMHEHDGYGE